MKSIISIVILSLFTLVGNVSMADSHTHLVTQYNRCPEGQPCNDTIGPVASWKATNPWFKNNLVCWVDFVPDSVKPTTPELYGKSVAQSTSNIIPEGIFCVIGDVEIKPEARVLASSESEVKEIKQKGKKKKGE